MKFDVEKASAFTKSFFDQVEKSSYLFFVEEGNNSISHRRNPLEGTYPIGRTGKTSSDPLQAFWYYNVLQRDKAAVAARVIVPGRHTPVLDQLLPVYQRRKKLERGSSGKYRHIASYSLDELVDLKWDGSLYFSEKGYHAANGYHVPFIPGYDSDSADDYEPIDVKRGKQEGVIGLSKDQIGLFITVPVLDCDS